MPPAGKPLNRPLRDRFYDHAIIPEDPTACWGWNASHLPDGRARLVGKDCPKNGLAAVASYIIHKGPIPEGLIVCHSCNNGHLGCVNPAHLEADTWSRNARDRVVVGNHATQKLTVAQVSEIRERLASGESGAAIARDYNVGKWAVYRIRDGKTFSNL